MHDVVVRFSLEDLDETTEALSFRIADGVSDLLGSLGSKVGPRGITAKMTPPGAVCHLDERKEDAA